MTLVSFFSSFILTTFIHSVNGTINSSLLSFYITFLFIPTSKLTVMNGEYILDSSISLIHSHLMFVMFSTLGLIDSIEIAETYLEEDNNQASSGMMVPFTLKKSRVMITGETGTVIDETAEATETRYLPEEYASSESVQVILHELSNNTPPSQTHDYMYWESVCGVCQQNPCVIVDNLPYLHELVTHMKNKGETNRAIRYQLYRRLSNKLHGPLGRGHRVQLPDCLVQFVRDNFPNENPEEKYVGFQAGPINHDE